MTGKILGSGVIKAEDGNRYNYDESELKNAKLNQKLDGLEVDFEVQEGKAVGVFITSKQSSFQFSSVDTSSLQNMNLPNLDNQWVFLDLNEAKANLLMPNIHSVKFYALLATFTRLFHCWLAVLVNQAFWNLWFNSLYLFCFLGYFTHFTSLAMMTKSSNTMGFLLCFL